MGPIVLGVLVTIAIVAFIVIVTVKKGYSEEEEKWRNNEFVIKAIEEFKNYYLNALSPDLIVYRSEFNFFHTNRTAVRYCFRNTCTYTSIGSTDTHSEGFRMLTTHEVILIRKIIVHDVIDACLEHIKTHHIAKRFKVTYCYEESLHEYNQGNFSGYIPRKFWKSGYYHCITIECIGRNAVKTNQTKYKDF